MKYYIEPKTGAKHYSLPNPWDNGEVIICGLTDDTAIEWGWQVIDEPEPSYTPTKEDIRQQREMRYREEVDPVTAEYTRKTICGEFKDAEEKELMKASIEDSVMSIRKELPYPPEEMEVI